MRVALISDIHGNLVALDAVLEDISRAKVDAIVCLGDIVDLGPLPEACVARVRERCETCIQGNHDPLEDHPELPYLADLENWTRDNLGAETRAWLDALPGEATLSLDGMTLLCVHGSPRSFHDNIMDATPESTLLAWTGDREFDVLACGHTHVQLVRRLGERAIVNVGSVGMPFVRPIGEGAPTVLPWAEYGIIGAHDGQLGIELRRVKCDLDAVDRTVRESLMPHPEEWISQRQTVG